MNAFQKIFALPEGDRSTQWNWLRDKVFCPVGLEQITGDQTLVFGTGSLDADIVFCGDVPLKMS